jgi:hypothetical protein
MHTDTPDKMTAGRRDANLFAFLPFCLLWFPQGSGNPLGLTYEYSQLVM